MKNKITLRGTLLAFCFVFLVSIPITCVIDNFPTDTHGNKSLRFREASLLAKRIQKFRTEHRGKKLEKITDALGGLTPDERLDYLSAPGVDQGWKPDGWHTNDAIADVYADYVLLTTKSGSVFVSERPGLFTDDRTFIFGTEKFAAGNDSVPMLFFKINDKELKARLESYKFNKSADVAPTIGDDQ